MWYLHNALYNLFGFINGCYCFCTDYQQKNLTVGKSLLVTITYGTAQMQSQVWLTLLRPQQPLKQASLYQCHTCVHLHAINYIKSESDTCLIASQCPSNQDMLQSKQVCHTHFLSLLHWLTSRMWPCILILSLF